MQEKHLSASLRKGGEELSRGHNACAPVLLEAQKVPAILCDEVVGAGFVGEAEKLHVGNISRKRCRHLSFAGIKDGARGKFHQEVENLVVRPPVMHADARQDEHGEQFLQNGLRKDKLKFAIEIGVKNAGGW